MKKNKAILGRLEKIHLPELNLTLKAKIDTGAKTSAMHATHITIFKKKNKSYVSFTPYDDEGNELDPIEWPLVEIRTIKSSDGEKSKRPVILIDISLDEQYTIEVSLIDRSKMGYKFLLGREALKGRYLVDPELSFCLKKRGIK